MYNKILAVVLFLCAAPAAPFCGYPGPTCAIQDEVIYYPYENNCHLYYQCHYGSWYIHTCGDKYWHQEISKCDVPGDYCEPCDDSRASDGSTGPKDGTINVIPDPVCPYLSEDITYYLYPEDCSKYWECHEGNKQLMNCPEGLWWHEEISKCDYPGDFCESS